MAEAGEVAPAESAPTDGSSSRLLAWAAGSMHAALLVASLALGLHLSGAAGDVLAGLGTLPGVAVYLYLWGVTVWTTGRGIRKAGATATEGVDGRLRAGAAAGVWGAATGALFLAGLLAAVAVALVAADGLESLAVVAVAAVVGLPVALLIGTAVGVAFGLLDLMALAAASRLVGADGAAGS